VSKSHHCSSERLYPVENLYADCLTPQGLILVNNRNYGSQAPEALERGQVICARGLCRAVGAPFKLCDPCENWVGTSRTWERQPPRSGVLLSNNAKPCGSGPNRDVGWRRADAAKPSGGAGRPPDCCHRIFTRMVNPETHLAERQLVANDQTWNMTVGCKGVDVFRSLPHRSEGSAANQAINNLQDASLISSQVVLGSRIKRQTRRKSATEGRNKAFFRSRILIPLRPLITNGTPFSSLPFNRGHHGSRQQYRIAHHGDQLGAGSDLLPSQPYCCDDAGRH
jgi:hypothetical protein